MVNNVSILLTRANTIYQEEGLSALIKRVFAYAKYLISSVISYENSTFYVYGQVVTQGNEVDYLPKIPNVTHTMIETIEQLNELAEKGYDLSLIDVNQARYRLQKGTIANLIFIDHEFGHISWTALTEEAQKTINRYPYKVDYENHETTSGASWTNPKYRRQGLANYAVYKNRQFCIRKGATTWRGIVLTDNFASMAWSDKLNSEIVAKARYIRIFGLQFWKESSVKLENKKDNQP